MTQLQDVEIFFTFHINSIKTILVLLGQLCQLEHQKKRNCISSQIDLQNMFFSVKLEEDSKSKTNFYWKNRMYCHNRLGQGLSVSPYISAAAMNYTFSDSVLDRFKNEYHFKDLPCSSYNQFMDFYIDDIILYCKRDKFYEK